MFLNDDDEWVISKRIASVSSDYNLKTTSKAAPSDQLPPDVTWKRLLDLGEDYPEDEISVKAITAGNFDYPMFDKYF